MICIELCSYPQGLSVPRVPRILAGHVFGPLPLSLRAKGADHPVKRETGRYFIAQAQNTSILKPSP
jgi:hypothetical protein